MQQYAVKFAMQQELNDEETRFEHLTISRSEYIKSQVEENEICLQGKMYDIKSLSFTNDSVKLLAIHDTDEEDIIKKIKEFFATSQSQKDKIPAFLIQLHLLAYVLPSGIIDLLVADLPVTKKHSYSENIITRISDIFLPPPECI
jgi:hypothetical protein